MAIKLQIRKQPNNVWQYIDVTVTPNKVLSSSKQHLLANDDTIEYTEPYGNDFARALYNETAVYDDTASGTEETFASALELITRLKVLGNPSFYRDADLVIADLISGDAYQQIVIGSDGGLYFSLEGITFDGGEI